MTRRRAAAALLAVLLAATGCVNVDVTVGEPAVTPDAGGAGEGANATVLRVVDGDTVRVEFANGTRDTVRLLGVDTPEPTNRNDPTEFPGVPDTEAGRACLLDWGTQASAYADRHLAGEEVRVAFDALSERRGYFGRLLAYVHVDGDSFNRMLLADGYARVYESRFELREEYRRVADEARRNDRGLWGACAGGTDRDLTPPARALARATPARTAHAGVAADRSPPASRVASPALA